MSRKGVEEEDEEGILAWIDSKINFLTANPQFFVSLWQTLCNIDLFKQVKKVYDLILDLNTWWYLILILNDT